LISSRHLGFGLGVAIDKTVVPEEIMRAWIQRVQQENYLKGIALWHSGVILRPGYDTQVKSLFVPTWKK
jgi:hypothetical protein